MSHTKKNMSIYLAGKIQKAHEEPNETYWTFEDQKTLQNSLESIDLHFLNPAVRNDDLSDQKSVLGRDMLQVFSSDIVFVDARDRRGLGVGAEMMWAKIQNIPVITLAPLGSHYHKESTSLLGVEVSSWVHPFVEGLSDAIFSSLEEAALWIKSYATAEISKESIRGKQWIEECMQHYVSSQLEQDTPMQEMSLVNEKLKTFIHSAATV